ncbi:PAS domain S-box protein, partial [Myxococcota bacterium]
LSLLQGGINRRDLSSVCVQVIETGEPLTMELPCENPGGTVWFLLSAVKLGDAVVVTLTDVTVRKRSELALRAREAKCRSVIDHSEHGVLLVSDMGRVVLANRAAAQILRRSVEELQSLEFEQLVCQLLPEDRGWLAAAVQRHSLPEHKRCSSQLRIMAPDGSVCWVDATTSDAAVDGERCLLVALADVTERKQAETRVAERAAAAAALHQSDELSRQLLNSAMDGVVVVSAEGGLVEANPAFCRMVGHARESILGAQMPHPCWPEGALNYVRTLAADPCQWVGANGLELELTTAGGGHLPVAVTAAALRQDCEPGPGHYVVTVKDLTEQRRAQESLRQVEEQWQAAQRLESIGRLAAGIAHDFNNSLGIVRAYASTLLQRGTLDQRSVSDVKAIDQTAEHAGRLAHQLLLFSRRQALKRERLDLNHVVAELEKMLRRVVPETIAFTVVQADGPCAITFDRVQIEQVLLNLVVNARQAMPRGGRLELSVRLAELEHERVAPWGIQPGRYAVIEVVDTGVGMDAVLLDRIFEPFFTTKPPDQGTGLGLSIVHRIVKQNGGHLAVQSEPGLGSCFEVYVPCAEPCEASARPLPMSRRCAIPRLRTILLVQDDEALRAVLARALRDQGYHVVDAAHKAAANRLLEQRGGPIDLVLTDVVLPDIGGRAAAVQSVDPQRDTPVLYLCGNGHEPRSCVQAGSAPVVRQPRWMAELLGRVRDVLERSDPSRAFAAPRTESMFSLGAE